MPILLALAAFVATVLGGLFALRFRDKLHLVLGFAAGAVVGVAFFDLLPEAIELAEGSFDVDVIAALVGVGFAAYLLLDRATNVHPSCDEHGHGHGAPRGVTGTAVLALHSFLDGAAIGLAFQVSTAVGAVVAAAVLVHKFSDGVSAVGLALRGEGSRASALRWLAVVAAAPILGAASTLFFSLSAAALGASLAVFAGFFLYLGASDLVPESHHAHPKLLTTVMTVLGLAVTYAAVFLAHGA